MKKIIFIGSDHAGFNLKEGIIKNLSLSSKYTIINEGTYSKDSCDYPDYAKKVCTKVLKNSTKGILICGTGIGMSISANRFKGIRAALVKDKETAILSREHNDANVLVLSSKTSLKLALEIIDLFMNTKTSLAKRHKQRRDML